LTPVDASTYSGLREILRRYGLTPSRRFGQNFLTDRHVLDKITAAAELEKDDAVVEVGAGLGALTRALAERAGFVAAVELDKRLAEVLRDMFADTPNVRVVQGDCMRLGLAGLAADREPAGGISAGGAPLAPPSAGLAAEVDPAGGIGKKRAKIVANLPYYITTPFIMRVLEQESGPAGRPFGRATLMVQREVAERIAAAPGTGNYGALSVAAAYYAECELNATVPPNCFFPRPDVDSAVITLKIYETPPCAPADEKLMFACVKAAFGQRRKTLANCLCARPWLGLGKERVAEVIRRCGFREDVRGETLGVKEFAGLAEELRVEIEKE